MDLDPQQQSNKPTRDDSLVAPAPASQPKLKTQAFKKKTKQVFIASDQLARMLKREEYQSWLLEDSLTGGEKWIGRFESAGAGSGPGTSMGGSSGSTIRASSAATTGSSKVPTYKASNYVVFCLDKNGENFTILPCHWFNKFTHCPNYDTLGPEEAEAAYEKMQKPTTKEDVGRWFMRRRGAAAGSNLMNPINQSTGNSSSIGISTSDFKQKQSLKPSIFDESKISLGSASRPQVKAVLVFGGRKGKFTAVHGGGNLMGKDEDEDVKPKLGQDGDFDKVDYDEEFANDEEGAGNLNNEAMEEDELRELEERMKREMLAAGRAGDKEKDRDNMIVDKDDLFGKRDDLTKEGKAVKKLLMRKADNNDVYDSDDDEEESDMEEVNPINPSNNGNLADTSTHPDSQSGTPALGLNNANSSTQSRNLSKVTLSRTSTSVKLPENPRSRPPSRAGTPSLAGGNSQARAISPRPTNNGLAGGSNNFSIGNLMDSSRASSPQPQPARKNQASLPIGSSNNNLANQRLTSPPAAFGTPSGAKRKHPGGVTGKEKRQNQCSRSGSPLSTADHQQQLTSSATSRTGSNSAGATGGNVKSLGPITEEEVVKLLKTRKVSSKELLTHFKMKLREEGNQQTLFGIVKRVATIVNGQITIK
ncbi:hypothetical protein PPACK8108_LOCUS12658 [Phakopsora pachyrhizi]|uniref:Transcription initiation factor IIF subunit alpha n=1 Tax=Phakopsora pachyrhizi TaxID=170000 RepID=A0AAV0B213_PHAPC|nr:hypothetical protein PPACK8108_LOCUS12658 [Phakopsora pachyrhizi]